jgi:prolyl-tRNA editing enzyme YbaK/EbsC (Cys-tRNA(Pro) deacylase)
MGAKSIVLKTDDTYRLFVLSGAAALASSAIRRRLGARRTRFATAAELGRLTGLRPGAVPPFGRPVLPLDLFVDRALLRQERIAFTPGIRTASIVMAAEDYRRLAEPDIFPFSRRS